MSARVCGEKFELCEDNSEVALELAIEDADAARARAGDGQRRAAKAGRGQDELDEISHCPLLRGGAREKDGNAGATKLPGADNPDRDSLASNSCASRYVNHCQARLKPVPPSESGDGGLL